MNVKIDKLKLAPAYQVVSQSLEHLITSGALRTGDPLPTEFELASNFGVNRSTVREGIRQLESEGLLRREGRRRLIVSRPTQSDLLPRNTRALVMYEATFRELWEVALVLEPLTASLAARNMTEELRAEAERNIEEMETAVARGASPGALDKEFHSLLSKGARNQALRLAREPIGLLLYPAFEAIRPHLPQAPRRMIEAHRRIVDAVRAGDADEAELWSRKHIMDLRRGWELAHFDPDLPVSWPAEDIA